MKKVSSLKRRMALALASLAILTGGGILGCSGGTDYVGTSSSTNTNTTTPAADSGGVLTDGALTDARVTVVASTSGTAGTITEVKSTSADIAADASAQTYASIAEALAAIPQTGSDTYTITLAPGTYKENGLTYKGSNTIIIAGTGTAAYGTDVLIYGQGTDMTQESKRSTLSFQGTCNIILKNLAVQNSYGMTEGTAQSEALGISNTAFSGTLAAYNCAFLSGQDTICTEGKAWFYKCYIEGDVDFLWIESRTGKVALYEECILRAIGTRTTKAYFTAPRLPVANTVGKGVVIWKSTLQAEDGLKNVYLGRNPWDKASDEKKGTNYFKDYYENVAVVGSKYYGTALNEEIWSGSGANGTENQQFVGFKTDSHFKASSTGIGARLTDEQVTAEYSNRNAILNRVYNIAEGAFENDSASSVWNVAATEEAFNAGTSAALPTTTFDATKAKVTWNFAGTLNGSTTTVYQNNSGTIDGTIDGSTDYTVKMHVNAASGKLSARSANNDTQINNGTILTVPVTDGSIVSVTKVGGTFGIEGTETTTYTHSGAATGVVIYPTANGYITEVSVSKLDLTGLSAELLGATATGEVQAIALGDSEKTIMNTNTYTLTATTYASYGATAGTVTWVSDAESVATVSSSGVVTAVANSGTATITATCNGHSATCTITAAPKEEVSTYTYDFQNGISSGTVSATEDTSKTITLSSGIGYQNTNYGAKNQGTVTLWLPGNSTITFYPTYKMTGTITLYPEGSTTDSLGSASIDNNNNDVKIGATGTQEPSQYAKTITYTGTAGNFDLVIAGSNVYFWKIVVEKTN